MMANVLGRDVGGFAGRCRCTVQYVIWFILIMIYTAFRIFIVTY